VTFIHGASPVVFCHRDYKILEVIAMRFCDIPRLQAANYYIDVGWKEVSDIHTRGASPVVFCHRDYKHTEDTRIVLCNSEL